MNVMQVGRVGMDPSDFPVLLPSSSFMSPEESLQDMNTTRWDTTRGMPKKKKRGGETKGMALQNVTSIKRKFISGGGW